MAKKASPTDFTVEVPKVGSYIFARRTTGDAFKIRGLYAQFTAGNYSEDGRMHDISALAYCTIKVLAVEQPKDFHIEDIDPLLDDGWDEKLVLVYFALSEQERSFRPGSKKDGAAARPSDGENVQPLVPQDVPAGAN
jgi:hypothetical protein